MKHVVSLLMIALCASALQAITVQFQFPSSYALTYEDGTTVTSGEILRVVFVSGSFDTSTIPFTIDAAGQLTATSSAVTVGWGSITTIVDEVTTTSLDSIPLTDEGTIDAGTVQAVSSESSIYGYLVLFDTRSFSMVNDQVVATAGGAPVGSIAIAPIGNSNSSGAVSLLTTFTVTLPAIARFGMTASGYIGNLPGTSTYESAPASSWQAAAEITSLTVDGTTYDASSSPTLDEYLTPAVSGLSLDTSTGKVTLTGSSNDAIFYTIETTDSLSGTWVPLTEFLTSSGKTLDTATQMYYSRMRLDKEGTAIEIPIIEDDTARFYRFGSSNSSSEE